MKRDIVEVLVFITCWPAVCWFVVTFPVFTSFFVTGFLLDF
jgi:hypothetical protein